MLTSQRSQVIEVAF